MSAPESAAIGDEGGVIRFKPGEVYLDPEDPDRPFKRYDDEHFPWNYTEFGVLCACGSAMRSDETCLTREVRDDRA